ncbi:uncharacterized protein LOC128718392 [Anopheles marshallii]|uniref:uncharacterized protein LOC128718392 n=1 Tax=Anopheles marshallii TaxID=1521116 RepID=UPI00237B3237|nr:uncharacterized protein LOC128718392 [Anopheles marshallii]
MSKRGYSIDSDTQPAKVTRKNDEPVPQTSKTDLTSHVDLTERSITVGQDEKASDKNQSATTKQVISIIEKSVNPASTIQGELYCTYLAISIILHQFKKQNKFVVATEVSEAGKFDDILYHYESPNDTSTFYIQAKHKKKFGVCITERDLCVTNGEFSIPMYFSSFLAIDKKLTEGVPEDRKDEHKTRYAICTNAELHKNVERYFTEIEPQEDESLQFCEDIGATCYQFFCDIPALIAPLRKSYIDKLKTEIGFYTQKDDFFSKFLLICKSCNQEKLRSNAGNLLPKWCDKVQRETVIDKLEALLINGIHNQRRYYMNLERMQHWISGIEPNQHVGDLRRSSEECLKSGQEKYPYVEIDPKRLKELKLYAFVKNASDCGVYEFNSRFDWIVSCRILDQALSLLQCETLFVDSTKYTTQEAMMNILDDLLLYLRDVNHSAIKVITILANHSHGFVGGIKKITEKYCHKIIVVVKMSEGSQKGENFERILVQDLSENASNQLHKQAERMMFGTIAPLSSIVEATDDLSFLIYVLELCGQSRKVRDINLNEHNYEQIKHWYVQRHFEPYDYEGKPESSENLLIKGPSLLHVERVLASNDKEPVAPSFRESNGGKVCIFLNDAGFGKTTYFTWLAWHLSTSDPSLYFVKITALEYSTDFDRLKQSDVQNSDDIKIVRILYRYIHLALFVQRVNSRNIEEIDKDRNKADDCAKLLTFASDKGKLVLKKANKLSTKDLIELRMFQQKFNHKKLVIILDGFDEITPWSASISASNVCRLHLVERIINRKIEIFIKDKAIVADKNTEEQWKKEIKEQHMLLASYVIFDKNDREILLSSKEQKRAIEIIEEVNQGDVTTGIVIGVQNEVPQFIHRMYAEYFTACWLYENWERFKSESIFRSQTIWSYRFKEIREFFDRLILRESEGCDLHLALVNKSHEEIKKVLRDKPSLIDVKDKVGRLPLHLLHYLLDVDEDKGTSFYRSILNKLDEVNQILQNPRNRDGEFINQKDELCKWNALDYAFVLNEWDLTGYLFTKGVEPDMDNLIEQVCSNHLDTLLVQEKKYTNKCFGRKDLPDVLSERMAKYLIEHKQIDVYSPIAELNSLSVLDKVVTIGSLSMLRQLITTSDPQGFGMDDRANRLLQLSLDNRFDKITMYLVEQHPSLVSFINDGHVLYFCAKSAIQNNLIELFITIFTKFCFTQKIDCVEEDKIIDEFVDLGENETFEVEIPFEKYCCIQYTSQELESNEEGLLCAAIHYGNIQIVSYILQKTNKAITFKLVKQIMQQLRGVDHNYRNHKTCAATFKYLFKKIPDLYAVDEEELNLFLMTIKYGCVYMLHSLIAIGFDTTKINMINLLKVFQQRLNSWAEKSSANIFVYLEQRSIVDFYDKLGPMSERIFDIAISKERFIVAKALVENKFRNLSNSEKQNLEELHQ